MQVLWSGVVTIVINPFFCNTLYRRLDYDHKRILWIRLKLVEKHLRDIVSTLESNTYNSAFILYSIRDNIDSEDRMNIISITSFMLDEIRQIKKVYSRIRGRPLAPILWAT